MDDVEVTWSSNVDGVVANRGFSSTTRLSEGEHTLTCTASDGTFAITRSVSISIGNDAPTVSITNPNSDGVRRFYRGQSIALSANVFDLNGNEDLSSVRWTASQDAELTWGGTIPISYWDGAGLNELIEARSLHAGVFTLTVSVLDDRGLRGVDTVTIEILEDPPGADLPPSITGGSIVPVPADPFDAPPLSFWLDECSYDVNGDGRIDAADLCQRIRLSVSAEDDHDAPGDMTYLWTVQQGAESGTTTLSNSSFEAHFEQGRFTVSVIAVDSAGNESESYSWTFNVTTLI
jgi:hypothetical protein